MFSSSQLQLCILKLECRLEEGLLSKLKSNLFFCLSEWLTAIEKLKWIWCFASGLSKSIIKRGELSTLSFAALLVDPRWEVATKQGSIVWFILLPDTNFTAFA
jgi:hypothetical protein